MARNIVRRSFSGRRSPGRLTEWFGSADISAATALAAATFNFSQSLTATELAKRPFTVTRTIGSIWVASDQNAQFEDAFGAIGFIVVSDKAVATGVTALPDPITQESSDEWFVYRAFKAGIQGTLQEFTEHQFDSRAQRKVGDGEDIAVMVANAHSAHALDFILKFRLLVKLS